MICDLADTKIAVILVNYYGSKDCALCLESLEVSNTTVGVVVVDNTPNDPELEDALASFPHTHLINATENLGFGCGNNLGIDWVLEHTDCEYIFILNNDATVEPEAMNHMLHAMELHPEAAVISPRIVFAETPDKLWYGGGEVDWKRGGGRVPGVLGPADAPLALQSRYVTFASGCAMLIRRDVLNQCGSFDRRYFMYDEDLELSLRVSASGWKIFYEACATVLHTGQGSLRGKQGEKFLGAWNPLNPNLPFYVFHILRNRLLTMKDYARGPHRTEFMVFFPLFVMAKALSFVRYRRWTALVAMYKAFLSYRKAMRVEK